MGNIELSQKLAESFAVFGQIYGFWGCADDRNCCALQIEREIQGRLAAELHDDAIRFLFFHDVQNVFKRKGFEIQAVGCVVIGRDGLRIAIDHDRLVPVFLEGEGCMAAAIIELNSLPNAVRPASKNDDLLAV